MRGIALTIFLSFWSIHAVLIAVFALLPGRGGNVRFANLVRQNGLVAVNLLEKNGPQSCAAFLEAVQDAAQMSLSVLDARNKPICTSPQAPSADYLLWHLDRGASSVLESTATGNLAIMPVSGVTGEMFVVGGVSLPGFAARPLAPPFPAYGPVSAAIILSGIVCFGLARYLTRPLLQMRDVSKRLASGELDARVGPHVSARRDEIGDLIRDFDRMADRLGVLVHSQTQLLSDISHELRSPLARLNVALELARRKASPNAHADLERIQGEADRMNDLIGRILSLARAEGAQGGRAASAVSLAEVVRRVAADAGYEAQQQHKTIIVSVDAVPIINGDPLLISSAIENVLRNALRYAPENSAIELTLSVVEPHAIITVRDHGPGVPDSELEGMFAPFHRVESARDRLHGGAGLGLAIARRAVAVHGGSIHAENAEGGGLRVTLRLPDISVRTLD